MKSKKYTLDDMVHLAKLGRFGNQEMNKLAAQAFLYIKKLVKENTELKNKLNETEKDINIYQVSVGNKENNETVEIDEISKEST